MRRFNYLISIVLPVHNGETFLEVAIRSILNQTYSNFELIIVDYFSKDNSVSI
ncbi:MAG TPA: glycosyltransferase, partial [Mariniflexile sp.]|nr:glycosyltransferase [Mariniflexile sp.]